MGQTLLFVATDRLSAFDHVLPNPIPDKGRVLCQLSEFWFERFASVVPNHVITTDVEAFPEVLRSHADQLAGRTTLVHKLSPVPSTRPFRWHSRLLVPRRYRRVQAAPYLVVQRDFHGPRLAQTYQVL